MKVSFYVFVKMYVQGNSNISLPIIFFILVRIGVDFGVDVTAYPTNSLALFFWNAQKSS